ncbi:hypothetical protein SAMD00019534_022320 [Acytostelium subglobosum LB1]|uniref:hypothetical protein n=1 Tax=Acytostelium subglobosum LB1 TaxID=1410327 RepID=UPI0006450778|nr:hypothetical protein SAMD00019534_022320 [Acytostelium subglobosum LB1]GAM19057.1 hypothetical protein SAMD00019534_022320 [Acytostelium subglobosum LB1]|eukprot:XP_012756984.1 hypothetical protein SAMD00019534_022320 [Acytostelium subglobosum LB1]
MPPEDFKMINTSTIGVDYRTKLLQIDGKLVKAQCLDTAGQERFRSIISRYYRGAAGAMIVYDITNRSTFDQVVHWLEQFQQLGDEGAPVMMVGNKSDLEVERKVPKQEAQDFAQANKMLYAETSTVSQSKGSVDQAFEDLFTAIYRHKKDNPSPFLTNISSNPDQQSNCSC